MPRPDMDPGGSGPDGGRDAVGEDLRRVGQRPGLTIRVPDGRPRDGTGVEDVVGGIPLALEDRRTGDAGGGESLEAEAPALVGLLARADRLAGHGREGQLGVDLED